MSGKPKLSLNMTHEHESRLTQQPYIPLRRSPKHFSPHHLNSSNESASPRSKYRTFTQPPEYSALYSQTYNSNRSDALTPEPRSAHSSYLAQMMPTQRKSAHHQHLMSTGSALTSSNHAIPPHFVSRESLISHQHSTSICTTPGGHMALTSLTLSTKQPHKEVREFTTYDRRDQSQLKEKRFYQREEAHKEPPPSVAGEQRLSRVPSIDVQTPKDLKVIQFTSASQITETSPISSTTTMSPPRQAPQDFRVVPLMTITSNAQSEGFWNAYEQKFEKAFGRNPYVYQNYIEQIVGRMDQKFDILGSLAHQENESDILLFRNKLYRVISDVQNDLREAANVIHILTQDRMRFKEMWCSQGVECEHLRQNIKKLKDKLNQVLKDKERERDRAEAIYSELEYYKSECVRLRGGYREPMEAQNQTRKEMKELIEENRSLRHELEDSLEARLRTQEPLSMKERIENLVKDLIAIVDSNSPLGEILQRQYETLQELEEAIKNTDGDAALIELLLKIIKRKGITRDMGTSPLKLKEARSPLTMGISPRQGSLKSLTHTDAAFQNESEIVRSQSRSMSQWESPLKQVQAIEGAERREEGRAKDQMNLMSWNLQDLKELVKKEVLAQINKPKPQYHRLQGESGEVSFHSSYHGESEAKPLEESKFKNTEKKLTPSSSENDLNVVKVKTTSDVSENSEEGPFMPLEYEEFEPGFVAAGGLETPDYGEHRVKSVYDSKGSRKKSKPVAAISEKTEQSDKMVDETPQPLEQRGDVHTSLRASEPPSEASKIDDYVETHIMAVRTATSPPPHQGFMESPPSKVLKAEMLQEDSQSEMSSEDQNRISTFARKKPEILRKIEKQRDEPLLGYLKKAPGSQESVGEKKEEEEKQVKRVGSAGTAGFPSETMSPSVRGQNSGNSQDLLRDLKKEDWPSILEGDSFSEEASSLTKARAAKQGAEAAAGFQKPEIIQQGPEEEEAGTPLRFSKASLEPTTERAIESEYSPPDQYNFSAKRTPAEAAHAPQQTPEHSETEDSKAEDSKAEGPEELATGTQMLYIQQKLKNQNTYLESERNKRYEEKKKEDRSLSGERRKVSTKKSRNDVITKKQQNPSNRATSLSVKVPYSELPAQMQPKFGELSPSDGNSSAWSVEPQKANYKVTREPEYFTFDTHDTRKRMRHKFKSESLTPDLASEMEGIGRKRKIALSRSHIEGHTSALRGSTISALETDSDYSNEGQKKIHRVTHRDYLTEALISSRARDSSRRSSKAHYKAISPSQKRYNQSMDSERVNKLEMYRRKINLKSNYHREENIKNASYKVDTRWARKEDPQYKLRRSVKHITARKSITPDLSHIESRVDTGLKKKVTPRNK